MANLITAILTAKAARGKIMLGSLAVSIASSSPPWSAV